MTDLQLTHAFAASLTIAAAGLGVLAAFAGPLTRPWRTVLFAVMTTLAVVAVLLGGLVVYLALHLGSSADAHGSTWGGLCQ